jgi:hypothetical protein
LLLASLWRLTVRLVCALSICSAIADEKVARAGIVELGKHGLVAPYPVLYEKDGARTLP